MAKEKSLQDLLNEIEKRTLDEQLQLQAALKIIIDEEAKKANETLDKIEKANNKK